MRLAVLLTLATTIINANAAENFGGITFHSSVPQDQIESIKVDLKYLYKTPVTVPDSQFISTSQMAGSDGPNMHNWLINRVRFVVGEDFKLEGSNVITKAGHRFPNTPVPEFGAMKMSVASEGNGPVKTIMTNIGGAVYIVGKMNKVLMGLNLDGKQVYATSPRTGILQVGEGLFDTSFRINKENNNAPANSINRLSTLFHEARHSDGNGLGTGFMHAMCPLAHPYGGHPACENNANGPYTLGALSTRHLLQNCTSCTTQEKVSLQVAIVDSFGRILTATMNDSHIKDVEEALRVYKNVLETYKKLVVIETEQAKIDKYMAEIVRMAAVIQILEKELVTLKARAGKDPAPRDATPEGDWTPVNMKQSRALMGAARK